MAPSIDSSGSTRTENMISAFIQDHFMLNVAELTYHYPLCNTLPLSPLLSHPQILHLNTSQRPRHHTINATPMSSPQRQDQKTRKIQKSHELMAKVDIRVAKFAKMQLLWIEHSTSRYRTECNDCSETSVWRSPK